MTETRAALHVLFALPPNIEGYGEIRIPAGLLVLGSLAEQAGHGTDFVISSSREVVQSCPSSHLLVLAPELPAAERIGRFAQALEERLAQALAAGARPVVALSCFSSSLYVATLLAGTYLRWRFPELPILVGGYHPTIDPDSLLTPVGIEIPAVATGSLGTSAFLEGVAQATRAIRERSDVVFDVVFQGRSERSFLGVLDALRRGGRRAADSRIAEPEPFEPGELQRFRYSREVLSRLAGPPGALADPGAIRRFDLCFSFGCPYRCHFCINSTRFEPWEGMDVEHAVETLEYLHREHGVEQFSVLDANFAVDPGWRRRFFDLLGSQPWVERVQLDIQASVGTFELADPSLLDRLGMTVQIGVESCSPEILRRMNKTRNPERYRQRLRTLIEAIAPRVDLLGLLLILGYPGETRATLRESLDFLFGECRVLERPNVMVLPQLYMPLLGTEAERREESYRRELGFQSCDPAWWRRGAASRFTGLRPSRELELATCARLGGRIVDYYLGEAGGGDPPPITVKTKLARRRFLASVGEILADP